MKLVPIGGPAMVEGVVSKQASSRDNAIKAFLGNQAQSQQTPVPNPTQISPEDALAIQATTSKPAEQKPNAEETPRAATPASVTPSEATKPQEAEQTLSPRYAQLARQERALRARDAQIKAEKAALQAEKDALAAERAKLTEQWVPKDRLTRETLQVLQEQGIDYNTLTQQVLSSETPDPRDSRIASLEAKLSEALEKIEGTNQRIEEGQQASYTQAVAMIRQEASSLVKSDPAFETIKATNSVNEVVDLIQKTFEEGLDEDHPKGTLLTVEEACQLVEEELTDMYTKVARIDKIQKRLAPKAPAANPPSQVQGQQSQGPKPSLTNAMTGAPKKEYDARQRARFAAQYGENWREKVGSQT